MKNTLPCCDWCGEPLDFTDQYFADQRREKYGIQGEHCGRCVDRAGRRIDVLIREVTIAGIVAMCGENAAYLPDIEIA